MNRVYTIFFGELSICAQNKYEIHLIHCIVLVNLPVYPFRNASGCHAMHHCLNLFSLRRVLLHHKGQVEESKPEKRTTYLICNKERPKYSVQTQKLNLWKIILQ